MHSENERWLERLKGWWVGTRLGVHVRGVSEAYRSGASGELALLDRAWATPLHVLALTVREFVRDQSATWASSLAFVTVLSIVPLLSVATALLGAFGMFEPGGDTGFAAYLRLLFPEAGRDVVVYLNQFSKDGAASIGGISGISLMVISVLLFNSVERALTTIWRGRQDRSLLNKFVMFYTVLTLGPVLITISIVQTANTQLFIQSHTGIDTGFVSGLLPFGAAFLAFTMMNKLLPNARVDWGPAVLAGVVTTISFEVAKWGFNQYIVLLQGDSYNKLYGALSLAPLFMAWVYVTWLVILIGAEIAFCYQNMNQLLRSEVSLERFFSSDGAERLVYDEVVCLEMFAIVATRYQRGKGPVSEAYIGHKTEYDPLLVQETMTRLIQEGLLLVTGKGRGNARMLVPGRGLQEIGLMEIVGPFVQRNRPVVGEGAAELFGAYERALEEMTRGRTALDLVSEVALEAGEEE